jgi:hypothetical protein
VKLRIAVLLVGLLLAVSQTSRADNLFVSGVNGGIEEFDPSGAGTVFASSEPVSGLHIPRGLAFDSAGNLYVANLGNNTIEKFTSSSDTGTVFASFSSELGGAYFLAFEAIPEPSSFLLAALGGVSLVAFLKRKERRLRITSSAPTRHRLPVIPAAATVIAIPTRRAVIPVSWTPIVVGRRRNQCAWMPESNWLARLIAPAYTDGCRPVCTTGSGAWLELFRR